MNRIDESGITAGVKLTIHKEERFFGPGICELLERIRDTGSIQAAAMGMNMSYTKAWKIIKRAEKEMGADLIIRVSGGKNGGSSALTEAGMRAVKSFREMEKALSDAAGELLKSYRDDFLPPPPGKEQEKGADSSL